MKSSYLHDFFLFIYKTGYFIKERDPYLWLYFIHLTQITLRPNVQLLNNRQPAYQSFLSPGSIPFAILWHNG